MATDCGFPNDVENWAKQKGHQVLSSYQDKNDYIIEMIKGSKQVEDSSPYAKGKDVTIVLMSGEYDKAMAALIIANGARAYGHNVSIFCTFWGLTLLKNGKKISDPKQSFFSRMFKKVMPSKRESMPISSFNMGGLGRKLMKDIMKEKNVDSLDTLYDKAIKNDINFIACTMSMDVMGVEKEELDKNVELGGIGTYIAKSDDATITLFI